ncbi:MAG: glutathione S-transferase family protein [Pseudomonadota bacterium]
MALELISFKTCPFVQRSVITLNRKQIEYSVTYIDLADPPQWFLDISPLGKVPVLKVDGQILFESAVINEYIDEITGGELQPANPLERARNRAWIEVASDMLGNSYMMKMANNGEDYQKYRDTLISQLRRIENEIGTGPWFNGENFSLADTAFAPLFMHNAVADERFSVIDANELPNVAGWAKRLLALPEVQKSVVPDFEDLYLGALERNNTYIWQQHAA